MTLDTWVPVFVAAVGVMVPTWLALLVNRLLSEDE